MFGTMKLFLQCLVANSIACFVGYLKNTSCVWCLENAHFCLAYTDIGGIVLKALVFTCNKEIMALGKMIFILTCNTSVA
jgi:hypothetical protein